MNRGPASVVACLALAQLLASAQTGAPPASTNTSDQSAATSSDRNLSPRQIIALVYKAVENEFAARHDDRNYTFTMRTETQDFDHEGELRSKHSETRESMILYGEPLERVVAKDDKPLAEKEAAKEEKRLQKIIRKREMEGTEKRQQRLAKEDAKNREESEKFLAEFTEAFTFTLTGIELVEGREVYVIEAEPNRSYKPHEKLVKIAQHIRFTAWIDKLDMRWVKLTGDCIRTISVGWFLGRVNKGTSFIAELTKVNDEVWMPQHALFRVDTKILFSSSSVSTYDITFSNYKKFRADSTIVPVGEAK